jgi:hypothetical protein
LASDSKSWPDALSNGVQDNFGFKQGPWNVSMALFLAVDRLLCLPSFETGFVYTRVQVNPFCSRRHFSDVGDVVDTYAFAKSNSCHVLSTRDVPSLGHFNDSLLAPSLRETGPVLKWY